MVTPRVVTLALPPGRYYNRRGGGRLPEIRERDVEKYLVSRLDEEGLPCIKFVPEQMPGMPDRVVLLPNGRVAWVELKTEGGRLSKLQQYRHRILGRLGHSVFVVWTKDQADEFVGILADAFVKQKSPIGKSPIGKSPIGKSPIGKSPIGKSPTHTSGRDGYGGGGMSR